jgi:hypothetical protein
MQELIVRQPPRQSQLISITMPQQRVHEHFRLPTLSKHCLQTIMATSHCHCACWNAKYRWHGVDAQFLNGAGSVQLAFLPIMGASMSIEIAISNLHCNHLTYTTENPWHSVNSQFYNWAARVSLLCLNIKAVNPTQTVNDMPYSIFCN